MFKKNLKNQVFSYCSNTKKKNCTTSRKRNNTDANSCVLGMD